MKKINILAFILLVLVICLSCYINRNRSSTDNRNTVGETIIHIDTIFYYDTIEVMIKIPVKEKVVAKEEHKLPLVDQDKTDSAKVEITITQKTYQDSTYKAIISGYNPNLDSLIIYRKNEIITQNIYIPAIEYKKNKWSVGIQIGYGTNFQSFYPYIGIGVQYNFFSW